MDLFKRNIGFWIFITAACVGVVVMIFLILGTNQKLKAREMDVENSVNELERMQGSRLAINLENFRVAEANRKKAEGEFARLVENLDREFKFDPMPAMEPLACKTYISSELTKLGIDLRAHGITVSDKASDFSLAAVKGDAIPTSEDVPLFWHQSVIIHDVATAVQSCPGISQLNRISRLRGDLSPIQGNLYDTIPMEVQVVGTYSGVLSLINRLQSKKVGRFYMVRTFEFRAIDQAAGNSMPKLKMEKGTNGDEQRSVRLGAQSQFGRRTVPAVAVETTAAKMLSLPKEDRVLFDPSEITATLVVDCIEFKSLAK